MKTHEKAPGKAKHPSTTYARVDPSTLVTDEKGRSTTNHAKPSNLPKQVAECKLRSTSPVMMPSLLDMVIDKLKITEQLPPDLVRILERDGETMVHEYYAVKANRVIENIRKNRALQQEKKPFPQQNDISWAHDLIQEKLAKAEALVQGHMRRSATENEQQRPAARQKHPGTWHQLTPLTQQPGITQSLHAGPQCSSERDSRPIVPMTETKDHMEKRSRGDPRRPQRATVEKVTDSKNSSYGGTIREYIRTESDVSSLETGVIGIECESGEESRRAMETSGWRDEWALSDRGMYYS